MFLSIVRLAKNVFGNGFVWIDQRLKFSQLQKRDIAIRLGFDMDAPVTYDLFQLAQRVGPDGQVYGFDANPYHSLLGMTSLLKNAEGLNLTIIAGRYDETGTINGQPDYIVISELLHQYGFKTRLKRINHSFWWGFIANFLVRGTWVFDTSHYGILMAAKAPSRLRWFQTFS